MTTLSDLLNRAMDRMDARKAYLLQKKEKHDPKTKTPVSRAPVEGAKRDIQRIAPVGELRSPENDE